MGVEMIIKWDLEHSIKNAQSDKASLLRMYQL